MKLYKSELDEAKKIVRGFGYKLIKEAEDEDNEYEQLVSELAEETGNNFEVAEIEYNAGPIELAVEVKFGDEEYHCYKDYEDAEKAAQAEVKELMDDVGITGINFDYIGGIENFVDSDWFDDAKQEDAENYVYDIKESDPERYKEEFGDVDEDEAVEKYLKDYYNEDSIQWFIDDFGKKDFEHVVKQNNLIDLDKLAEAIVDYDGPANSLAHYDNEEIELNCGYYCYRTN